MLWLVPTRLRWSANRGVCCWKPFFSVVLWKMVWYLLGMEAGLSDALLPFSTYFSTNANKANSDYTIWRITPRSDLPIHTLPLAEPPAVRLILLSTLIPSQITPYECGERGGSEGGWKTTAIVNNEYIGILMQENFHSNHITCHHVASRWWQTASEDTQHKVVCTLGMF